MRADVVALLGRLAQQGGTIVCTGALTEAQITIARAAGRIAVDANGIGYVWVPGPKVPPDNLDARDKRIAELERELRSAKEDIYTERRDCTGVRASLSFAQERIPKLEKALDAVANFVCNDGEAATDSGDTKTAGGDLVCPQCGALPGEHCPSGVSCYARRLAAAGKNRDREAGDSDPAAAGMRAIVHGADYHTRRAWTDADIDRLATSRTGPVSPMVTRAEVERLVEAAVERVADALDGSPTWSFHVVAQRIRAAATAGGKFSG